MRIYPSRFAGMADPEHTHISSRRADRPSNRIGRRADLQNVAARLAAADVPSAPLYRAVADGHIALIRVDDPEARLESGALAGFTRPAIVLISGGPGWGEPTFGPGRWRCAKLARSWARCAIVHGAGGKREHYVTAIEAAQGPGRVLLIETTSALVNAWRAFLSPMPSLSIVPSDGGVHPAPPEVRH